jgi:hypothetical protein
MRAQSLVLSIFLFSMSALFAGAQSTTTPQTAPPSNPIQPQQPAPTPGRIQTRTRLVAIFSGLENRLFEAVQKKDQAALTPLLGDEFEIWIPNATGDPVPMDDWLAQVMGAYTLKSFHIRQMSARDFGSVVVVKFVYGQQAESQGKDDSGEFFVVDAWEKNGDSWKLSDRYISRFSALQPAHPVRPTEKQ